MLIIKSHDNYEKQRVHDKMQAMQVLGAIEHYGADMIRSQHAENNGRHTSQCSGQFVARFSLFTDDGGHAFLHGG